MRIDLRWIGISGLFFCAAAPALAQCGDLFKKPYEPFLAIRSTPTSSSPPPSTLMPAKDCASPSLFDGGEEKVINFNGHYQGELGPWQGFRIIPSVTPFRLPAGEHTLRIRPLDIGIVFEKILLDFGGLRPSYLGPPESPLAP